MQQSQLPASSPKGALEAYKHIELTEEELQEAILWRKQKKEAVLQQQERERRAQENRKMLTSTQWSYQQTRDFMLYRAAQIFTEKKFILDSSNSVVFDLLCLYFAADRGFVATAEAAGIRNPSLEKGVMLAGNFGTGKTWLMKLFQKNQRQVYHLKNAKEIADDFEVDGEEAMNTYLNKIKNAFNDKSVFYQPFSGLCIDDLGTEDVKVHFGNRKNVLGDLIEKRYAKGNTGLFLHATTNLTSDQLKEFYGGRVTSRMREIFNFIELSGEDRRV